jgi:hypothetical protein
LVVAGAVALSICMIVVASRTTQPLSTLDTALFQVLILGLGLSGSFALGRDAARRQPVASAPSAFRRLVTLYEGLGQVFTAITAFRTSLAEDPAGEAAVQAERVSGAFAVLQAHIYEQIRTADDAIGDWRDLAPNEVRELAARLEGLRSLPK